MKKPLVLVSHALCPFVQRVAIMLDEKGTSYERQDIDLANKPQWFLQLSPLGKTPLLLVNDEIIFESAVICEYLEDTIPPRLHPEDALSRARHRSWIEFGSAFLSSIGAFYSAPDEVALEARASDIRTKLEQLEPEIGSGPYFAGDQFCVVDAVFGPIFRYFDVIDQIGDFGFWSELPCIQRWRTALRLRPSVLGAVRPDYPVLLQQFILKRNSALSARLTSALALRPATQT